MTTRFKAGIVRMGWQRIFIVDEHGCLLHTEPVCTVPVSGDGHAWFVDWLEGQTCPYPRGDLLYHPMVASPPLEEE